MQTLKEWKFLGVALVCLVVASLTRFTLTRRAAEQPAVEFTPSLYDMGIHPQNEEIICRLNLVNRLEHPVELTSIRSTCGCATPSGTLVGKKLAAGDTCEVLTTFDTGERDGEFSASVLVSYREQLAKSDNGVRNVVGLLRCRVVPEYRITPPHVEFGVVSQAEPVRREVAVTPVRASDVVVEEATCDHPLFSAEVTRSAESGLATAVQVTFDPRGLYRETVASAPVWLRLTSTRSPTTRIVATAKYSPQVEIHPSSIVLSRQQRNDAQRQITVSSKPLSRIVAVRCNANDVSFVIPTDNTFKRTHVVTADVSSVSGVIHTEVEITLEIVGHSSASSTFHVPVHLF